jgi:HK97 family phage portal protein
MAWNLSSKSLNLGTTQSTPTDTKAGLGVGAPIALQPGVSGRGYKDSWDIDRAYREGMQKATWVFRCIDAIAGNQARLPMILRDGNDPRGAIVKTNNKKNPLLRILNLQSNEGENSFIFRYRLSAQLLMSTRGVFLEKITGRSGELLALQLLPPQYTSPIPDAKRFVAGYEIMMPGMQKQVMSPDKVLWIRRPHPLNPYLSLTPMESAGVAIEIENLAKLYNRNFLINDGRPGGLLVVRGEMDEDDKDELRARFRGNLNRTGIMSVIASDDGVDFVDTGASPRDAAYSEMRQITKEEILAAFGVPESVIGNASGRTFSNASEEIRVFWMETMLPHLEPLARGLDLLDNDHYVDFDTSDVPIMIISQQERMRYLKEEFGQGLISVNEYRQGRGLKPVDSELADSLLANPNLTPIANTEKKFVPPAPPGAPGAPPAPPAPPAGPDSGDGMAAAEADTGGGSDTPAGPGDAAEGPLAGMAAEDMGQMSASTGAIEYKSAEDVVDDWHVKAEQVSDRWTQIMDHSLDRFFQRQERVVSEKALGAKGRAALDRGELTADMVFDDAVWAKQLDEDIRPVLNAIISEGAESADLNIKALIDVGAVKELVDQQMARIAKINETTKKEIGNAILVAKSAGKDRAGMLKTAMAAVFAHALGSRKEMISEVEAQTALNAGVFVAAERSKVGHKQWVSRKDSKVRSAHQKLDGDRVPTVKAFQVDGIPIRFPGDPLAPPGLTVNCRCRLRYQP